MNKSDDESTSISVARVKMVEMKLDVARSDVEKAVGVLIKLGEKEKDFLNERKKINLTFSMKKVPYLKNKVITLPLPHGLATPELDVCLFVKDLDLKSREYEMTEEHVVDLLQDKGVKCVTKVIPVKALKLEYKPFEAKRNLSNMFDVFLADKRIFGVLPPLLGKAFYGRKRVPIQVDLLATDLKGEIDKALNSGSCTMKGRGSSCMATVAHSKLDAAQVVDNVMEAMNRIVSHIPGGSENIRNFYLKTEVSMAIPIYVSLKSSKDVILPERPKNLETTIIEEIDTVEDGKVRVKLTGEVDFVTEDGRIPSDERRQAIQKKLRRKAKRMKIKRLKEKSRTDKKKSSKIEKKSNKIGTVKVKVENEMNTGHPSSKKEKKNIGTEKQGTLKEIKHKQKKDKLALSKQEKLKEKKEIPMQKEGKVIKAQQKKSKQIKQM